MKRSDYILFRHRPNKTGTNGLFDSDDRNIYINEDLDKIHRELVYVHENQHRECFVAKCKCFETIFWCEYHAFRAELNFLLEKDDSTYWRKYFAITIKSLIKFRNDVNNVAGWKEHFKALRKVCRFKDFKKFAKKYKRWNQIKKLLR